MNAVESQRMIEHFHPEYAHTNPEPTHTHAWLWPALLHWLPKEPSRICDIGCGNGWTAEALARLGHTVTGFDPSPSGIALAKQRGSQVAFYTRSLYDPLPAEWKGTFDAVLSLDVIEHLYTPGRLPAAALELLRPGGVFLLSTPYHGYLKNIALAVSGNMDHHFSALWDHGHIKFFSKKTLRTLLHRAGFSDIHFDNRGRLPFLWKSMVAICKKPAARNLLYEGEQDAASCADRRKNIKE